MSSEYKRYSQCLERSVKHIFTQLFGDPTIDEIFENPSIRGGYTVILEMDGTLKGALRIQLPKKTLRTLAKKMDSSDSERSIDERAEDVSGEMANLIAGTFANQLQFINHSIRLFPPEFGDDLVGLTTFYENINMVFSSAFGIFSIDLFYKDVRK
jgi:CheY-specific phosphatase CheX